MKRILAVYYSQTGQLGEIMDSIVAPLRASPACSVTVARLTPENPYDFPWSFWGFFDTLPECIYDDPQPIEKLPLADDAEFDLIILGYQVWFISPSLPTTAFLQSAQAKRLLRGKPVITVIACRNMWLMAQERVKQQLQKLGATLIDNVALTERTHGAKSVITTPWWLLTGNKGPYLGGLLPRAGIWPSDIEGAARFGKTLADEFSKRAAGDARPMLRGKGAVIVHPGPDQFGTIRAAQFPHLGQITARVRQTRFAVASGGVGAVCRLPGGGAADRRAGGVRAEDRWCRYLTRERIAEQRSYFAAPSGE